MKILLVMDQFDSLNNGTTISAKRFADVLRSHSNEVRILSTGEMGPDKYVVPELKLPFFNGIVKAQGMTLAKPDKKVLEEALLWADVVHFYMPFFLSKKGLKMAKKLGIPHTAAFHVQPENITYNIGIWRLKQINNLIYKIFKNGFYDKFTHVHCPSNFIASELKRTGFKAQLHIISNGIDSAFKYRKISKPEEFKDKYLILMVGRLSKEKRQDVLINAIAKSKYADKIQLILAGQGPKKYAYMRLGKKLKNPPIFGFYSKEELIDIISMSDLYVHASDAEIEAISCMEAFATGLVPVIANSKKSATPQFALDERSLFNAGDSDDLAKKIDYWLEHEDERKEMEYKYSEHGKKFDIDNCVYEIEKMFQQAIEESKSV